MSPNKPKTKALVKVGRPPQSGAFSLLTKSSVDDLPKRRHYLRPYLIGAREGWIQDMGPTEEDLSTSQRILIDRAVTFLGAIRLTEEHMRERGLFDHPGGLLSAHLTQHYLSWNRALVDCLRLLGIEKKPQRESIPTLASIAAEIDEREREEAARAQDPVAGAAGNAQAGRSSADPNEDEGQGGQDSGGDGKGDKKRGSRIASEGRSQDGEGQGSGEDQGDGGGA